MTKLKKYKVIIFENPNIGYFSGERYFTIAVQSKEDAVKLASEWISKQKFPQDYVILKVRRCLRS